MLNIEKKIEEIRRQPEHIKLRYIYSLVAISMFFILILWFFSFFTNNKKEDAAAELKNRAILNDFETQKKSLQDLSKNAKNSINDLTKNMTQQADPSSTDQKIPPQSSPAPANDTLKERTIPVTP